MGGSLDLENAYQLTQTNRREVPRFKTTATDYLLKVNQFDISGLRNVLDALEKIFGRVLSDMTKGMGTDDQIRFVMQSQQLPTPISLPFMPVRELTPQRMMFEVERVLQSHEDFSLDGSVHINLIHVAIPSGGKRRDCRPRFINLEERLKKKNCFVRIRNRDELCCARAIVTAIARIDNDPYYAEIRHGRAIQRERARLLHERANVPFGTCGIEEIKKFESVLPDYRIVVVSADYFNAIIYKGQTAEKVIYLYHHDTHYEVITTMTGFLGKCYFCPTCLKGYEHETLKHHRCKNKCACCHTMNCPGIDLEDDWRRCEDCERYFRGDECFQNHQKRGAKGGKSVCQNYCKCPRCQKVINRSIRSLLEHKCGEVYCKICHEYVEPNVHRCYVQLPRKRKAQGDDDEEQRPEYFFFDFECRQEDGIHVPNLVVVKDMYNKETIFRGDDTKDAFCRWLFQDKHADSVWIAHNLKGYDSYFVLQYLYDNAIMPHVILNGAKVMQIEVKDLNIKFIDSLNFFIMPLSALPEAFGLTEMEKGFFPHFFNTKANEEYRGPLPGAEYYDPDGMKPETRAKFLKWHQTQTKNEVVFDMKEDIVKYCRSDVDILRRACLQFQTTIQNICNIDPFKCCMTIASLCNLIFRQNFLKENTIAAIPSQGYNPAVKYSLLACQWLSYESHKNNICIRHARNGGEVRIGSYYVDGFDETTNTAYEFDGCLFHGHPLCYPAHMKNPFNELTMQELYEKTLQKKRHLEDLGINVVHMWECEFHRKLKEDKAMSDYVNSLAFINDEPLNPRDAFFGGRTNAVKLWCDVKETAKKIKYVDYTSLYPWVNKYGVYPIGHPTIITQDFDDVKNYFGLIKCDILPPRDLYHPVLPFKCNKKLMFALCHTCASTMQQMPCHHTEDERTLHGVWVSLELNKAIEKGYRIAKIYEVWHFPERSNVLFREYVDMFLKKKQEASGWPKWCKTEQDKGKYIKDYLVNEGIQLDRDSIEKNPGERTIWKSILNNFWGKWGQRVNRPQAMSTTNPAEYFDMLTSQQIEVTDAHLINERVVELFYKQEEDFVETPARTNVVLACFTTAQARLKLYEVLEKLDRRVLYFDTDSVVYVTDEGEWEPPLGDYLGQLTDELKEEDGPFIETFVSAGPKNYAYKTAVVGKVCCKVRGFTLNFRTGQKINMESMLDVVKHNQNKVIPVTNPHKIVRDRVSKQILSKPYVKKYALVYNKRVVKDDYSTLPYGF